MLSLKKKMVQGTKYCVNYVDFNNKPQTITMLVDKPDQCMDLLHQYFGQSAKAVSIRVAL